MAIHVKGNRKFFAQLGRDAEQFQDMLVGRSLIGPFGGQTSLDGVAVRPVRLVRVRIADFDMAFFKRGALRHAEEAAQAVRLDAGVLLELVILRLGQILKASVTVSADLAEVGLLEGVVDGHGDRDERGEEDRGQGDSQDGDEVARAVGTERAEGQAPDAGAVLHFTHAAHPLILPSSMRMMRSDSWAISSL